MNMQSSSNQLTGVADGLQSTATRVRDAAESTTFRSNSVSAAAEEMSASLASMRDSIKEVGGIIQNIASASTQVSANTASVSRSTSEAAQIALESSQLATQCSSYIKELETAAVGIGCVVETIQGIAEQTNLLALNATIEASRAGADGHGFRVVAGEVKELAGQTTAATTGIRGQIESIQQITQRVVDYIHRLEQAANNVSGRTDDISASVEQQQVAVKSVTERLNDATRLMESLTGNVQETVLAANEVSSSIHEVHDIANGTSREVNLTTEASSELKRVSEHFSSLLSDFAV